MTATPRVPAALPEDRLERRLADAKPLYTDAEAVVEAHRCLYCQDAPCIAACPTGIDVPTFIRKIGTGNLRGAARTILQANLLGYSCARVCPVEVLCAGACVYNSWDREPPIAIGRLQRYATESVPLAQRARDLSGRAAASGRKVACVGGGPASLACAGYLTLAGVEVTVFERHALAGGLNTTGVAPYKMPADDALREVEWIAALGAEIRTGVEIRSGAEAAALLDRYDALFLAPGLGEDARLGIPGESAFGVFGAVEWIERMKLASGALPPGVARAVVIGGGNTALDAARELAGLGVAQVELLYRRSAAEMSGYRHELDLARQSGVVLVERAIPKSFVVDADLRLTAIELEDGTRRPCDLAIVAIGQAKLAALASGLPGVERDPRGAIVADPATGRTGHPRVFAGGDAVRGGELVVTAVQDGKRAARAIATTLGIDLPEDSPLRAGHA